MTNDNEGNDDEIASEQGPRADISEVGTDRLPASTADESQPETTDAEFSRNDWESLPSNPDPGEDLDYRISDWESFHTADNTDQIIYMPDDESLLKEDAFIVAEEAVLCELDDYC
jgi:hypothetical protein